MDTRQKSKQSQTPQAIEAQKVTLTNDQLNDSLIYNIMKKIQLRERLIQEYTQDKEQMNKTWITKYIVHGQVPVYYGAMVVLSKLAKIIYMKKGSNASAVLSIPNVLFHVCVFVSLNEYCKYRNIFFLKHQLGEEYRIHQRNVDNLMEEKIQKFSLLEKLAETRFLNQQKLMHVLKYRLVV